ncbi:Type II secretion system protein E [Roseimaritima multifibrata]|uniref:Type II secretion system protein E n=1 Tax=Roseimaritima multifibrata TaxID=1930274 RepID=A0A517MB24_9BACT|nr:ATPase, T2SS/T4P/T4SS family [Roseimaritima multifibrata]QDS92085.1 Type II secretion system protein E [Roseimaritima multifibrata]
MPPKDPQEEPQLWQSVPPIEFSVVVGTREQQQGLEILARQAPGYPVAAGQIAHALKVRATHIMMDFTQQATAMRYQIDGQWENLPPLPRDAGDAMLYTLKQVSGLNPADRRSAQLGKCATKVKKAKFTITVQSQGTKTGERVLVRIEPDKAPFAGLTDLGMRDKMREITKAALDADGALVLISAPKGTGLTTTWQVSMEAADRLTRDFQSVENEDRKEPETINISANYYGPKTGKTAGELVRSMILKEPDVFVLPEIPDDEVLASILDQVANNEKAAYTRLVAQDAVEAAVKLVAKHRSCAKAIASTLKAVTSQRLVRRLCENCRQPFEPSPQLLKQLGIPQGRVGVLYRAYVPPPIEQQVDEKGNPAPVPVCHVCNGRSYLGRAGVFELLQPGPQFRAALLKTQDVNKLRQVAKAEGHRGLQTEAVLTVARGITSLEEVKRVFAGG